jgi:hypothetical protein
MVEATKVIEAAMKCGPRMRMIEELPALLEKRDFYLCCHCYDAVHQRHVQGRGATRCECDDWNDAMRLHSALAPIVSGLKFAGKLHVR